VNATALDLRTNLKNVLAALGRNECVTLTYRGRKRGVIVPCGHESERRSVREHPGFGMWREHSETADVDSFVRGLRHGRRF
jgi:antitoxin (DNA-binding transcriptional repressor) of toxin-antitoxin stability system